MLLKQLHIIKFVAKVDNIDTSNCLLKTKLNDKNKIKKINNTDKRELENKIPDTSGLVKKTNYNTKIAELENKIPDTSGLVKKTIILKLLNQNIKFLILAVQQQKLH